ncbi:uncharacterized protein UBRO_20499 [Ustilago bromivora]|uniref:DDE-1 domain-containing protein n=1 Tax=Ustilago bromivora TaxID=307758 RepID=A0A1K0GK56_9BASI|nr:uncharacterized protein UBRO_20499 [Ustilago bromivora]
MVNISPRKRVAKAQLQTDRDQKEHEIQEALSAFQKGQFKDLKAAAEHHNVPYNTLWDHSKGCKSCTAAFQHLQAILPEAEELLVQHIQKQAHYGFLKTIAKYRILPENIFNMDKTGFLIGQTKDWVFATSQNGWTNNELALHWLKDCFDKHTKQRAQGKYQLLILDGHGSHNTAELIQQAWDSHIVCLCLPPHATHLLQPLDVVIFGPLQQAFTKEVDKFAGANLSISKKDFIDMYSKSQQVITSTLASQAFREVGIDSKLHPEKVLWCMPSYHRESTPPSSAPAVEETPTTPSTPEEAKKLLAQMYAIMDRDQEEQQALLASNH